MRCSVQVKPWGVAAGAVRWIARVGSVASVALLLQFLFGGGEAGTPTASEAVALAFFPIGVTVGMALGWWREWWGGLLTAGSLGAFYLWIVVQGGQVPSGPYFVLFALPGLLWLLSAWIAHAELRTATAR